jgi:hypothetical protein
MNTTHERVNGAHPATAPPPMKPIRQAATEAIESQPAANGETKRVKQLRAEVAEAHLLAHLQEDATPLALDTGKVRKHRKKAAEAARLHQLAQDPMMRAYRALRTRRRVVAVAMVSLALALGWSTAGVQAFAAEGAEPWSPRWVFAWLVEPFMSLALIVVVYARTYLATLGQPIESKTLTRVERIFLGLTVGMNAWPYLPWSLPDGREFSLSSLVLHLLGPIVAVAIVVALPIILAAFTNLDLGLSASSRGRTVEGEVVVDRTEPRTGELVPPARVERQIAFVSKPAVQVMRRAFTYRPAAARTAPVRKAYVFRTRSVTPAPEPVDRDVFVREITADILSAAARGEKWSPDYDRLMERSHRRRSWCEKAVRDARAAVFGTDARTGEAAS